MSTSSLQHKPTVSRPCQPSTSSKRQHHSRLAAAPQLLPVFPTCRPLHPPFSPLRIPTRHARHSFTHQRSPTHIFSTPPAAEPSTPASDAEPEEPVGPPGVPREEWDFDYLQTKVDALAAELSEALGGTNIYLVGMMGSGKTTVGRMLSFCLKYCFFDVDTIIEQYHQGTTVAELFKSEGEDYFRTCETEVLKQLSPYKNCVISTGGGAVVRPNNWSYMQHGVVVWLQGTPELLAQRVVSDGAEKRPLLYTEGVTEENVLEVTTAKIQKLYEARKDFYATADITISLEGHGKDVETGAPTAVVLYRLMTAVLGRIREAEEENEDRKNFTIEGLDSVSTMKVKQSPVTEADTAPEE